MKVLISPKVKALQSKPAGVEALRKIIVAAKFNEPTVFKIPSDGPSGNEKIAAQFVPVKGNV